MRISDWSSDVCSSYLANCRQVKHVAAIESDRRIGRCSFAVGVIDRDTAQIADVGAGMPATFAAPVQGDVRIRFGDAGNALAGLHRGVERGARCRSEEHTSELQSLMRISYAVVCLKKKKCTKQTVDKTL